MASCKKCLFFKMCLLSSEKAGICEEFKDSSKFIELPCNIGDTIYHLMLTGTIAKRKVIKFILTDTDGLCCVLDNGEIYSCAWRSIFLTKEQAEEALKISYENRTI